MVEKTQKNILNQQKKQVLKITAVLSILLISILGLSGCTNQDNATIKIEGAFALTPMMEKWVLEYNKIKPEITIDINANGAGAGMADALLGIADIGMVSREIDASEIERGAFWISVAKDAVVPTINANNPVLPTILEKGITRQQFKDIFITGTISTWGQLIGDESITNKIIVYTRSDSCGAAETWAKYLGDYKQNDIGAQIDLDRISAVNGDNTLAATIQREQYGIGFNNIGYVYTKKMDDSTVIPADGILPIPIDLNENGLLDEDEKIYADRATIVTAINNNIFPSPPARALHLVTLHNFTGITKAFVEWILTEGQQYVLDSGYVPLSEEIITAQLEYLHQGIRPEI